MLINNTLGRFLFSKHAKSSFGEPEVVVESRVSHNAWQNYITSIGTISVVIYTKFRKKINHRSRDSIKEAVINNDFNVTLPSGRRYFWTHIGNSTRTCRNRSHSWLHLMSTTDKMAIKLTEYQLRNACYNVVSADVYVDSIYQNPLLHLHKVYLRLGTCSGAFT